MACGTTRTARQLQFDPNMPKRLHTVIPVPKTLTTKNIAEVANIVASRVCFDLGAVAIQRNREKAEARYAKTGSS
ncbi:MAG: hypothetical protein WBW75_22285 [Mycobacterium sp.]|uniref:hypothetical protein n=1 Tax=Mycobacterium sp. TaxID=1785 RepID=UPI003C34B357